MLDTALADRSQQRLGEPSVPPVAHDQQICPWATSSRRRAGLPSMTRGMTRTGRSTPAVSTIALARLVRACSSKSKGSSSGGLPVPVVRVLPGEDRLDHASGELGLSDRPPQGCLRLLRSVDPDHDPSRGCRPVAHRPPPSSFRHCPSFPAPRRPGPLRSSPLTRFAPRVPPSAAARGKRTTR